MARQLFCSQKDDKAFVINFDNDWKLFTLKIMLLMLYKLNNW